MTENRNTPSDIVFDMEDDVSNLRRHANTLRITLQVARIKLLLWRILAERAACRAIRRAVDWLAPAG